jgi:cysteine desulfurase
MATRLDDASARPGESSAPRAVYLDWNATTPVHPRVREAMRAAEEHAWGNPASVHGAGRAARAELETAREALGAALGFHPRDIAFTGSGTEANNLALHDAPMLVTSRIEHPSVVALAEQLEARGVPVRWLPVGPSGAIEPDAVRAALAELGLRPLPPSAAPQGSACGIRRPTVAVMAANHETGVVQPLEAIAEVAREVGAALHVDAVQLVGRGAVDVLAVADTVSIAAHKLRGPKGIGALLWRPGFPPRPVLRGGAQERGLRPGTQDAGAAAGFRAAIERLDESRAAYVRRAPLRDRFDAELASVAQRNGEGSRLPHVTNLSVAGWRGDEVVAALDLQEVFVSSGSACSAGTTEPSAVITAMVGRARASEAVRISLGEETTLADIERALSAFKRTLGVPSTL